MGSTGLKSCCYSSFQPISRSSSRNKIPRMTQRHVLVLGLSDVAWQVAVVRVVNVFAWVEHCWLVEAVQFVSGLLNIVLDTIAILIIDGSERSIEHSQGSLAPVSPLINLDQHFVIIVAAIGPRKWVLPPILESVFPNHSCFLVVLPVVYFGWTLSLIISRGQIDGT